MLGTIATPYTPRSDTGREILAQAIEHGPSLDRAWLARKVRALRAIEGNYEAENCLAWLDVIGGYPVKVGTV